MGLEGIKERLLEGARKRGEARLESARREAEAILARGRQSAEEMERRLVRKARQEADARRERLITDARLAARKAVLAEKQAVLDEVFRAAMESFAATTADLRAALKKALLEAVETGEEAVTLAPSDREAWGEALIEELNRELASRGRPGNLRLADSGPEIASGAVLHRPGVEVNLSLEVLGRQARERLEEAVAKILFGADTSGEDAR